MKRCIIIGGAAINNYSDIIGYLDRENDYYIFCDSGLKHMDKLGVKPDLIIGDFDSHQNPRLDAETIVLPCEKDDTDTVFAAKEALKRGFEDFILIGVVGARLDHTLGNISILLMLHNKNKKALIIDDYSEMEIVSAEKVLISDSYPFFSLLNISGTAKGIYIENAKYPLKDAVISCDYQYGISNEVLPGCTAIVSVKDGMALLIKIRHE